MPADGYTTPNDDESPAQANLEANNTPPRLS
jgi:hypothetical protein